VGTERRIRAEEEFWVDTAFGADLPQCTCPQGPKRAILTVRVVAGVQLAE
jgi:hypothetical protein